MRPSKKAMIVKISSGRQAVTSLAAATIVRLSPESGLLESVTWPYQRMIFKAKHLDEFSAIFKTSQSIKWWTKTKIPLRCYFIISSLRQHRSCLLSQHTRHGVASTQSTVFCISSHTVFYICKQGYHVTDACLEIGRTAGHVAFHFTLETAATRDQLETDVVIFRIFWTLNQLQQGSARYCSSFRRDQLYEHSCSFRRDLLDTSVATLGIS